MKKLIAFLLIFSMQASLYAAAYPKGPCSALVGATDSGAVTAFQIDSAFVFGTSGDSASVSFNSIESQTSTAFTVYVYCTAATGSPTNTEMYVYASATGANDDDRPDAGSSPIATSSNVDASGCGTAQWLTYSFSSVSLTEGNSYWLVLANTTATPASNHFSVTIRGSLDSYTLTLITSIQRGYGGFTNTDGFTTDPTGQSSFAPWVIKYNSGTVFGNPYVVAGATLASNTNWRGMRFTPTEDIQLNGIFFLSGGATQQYYRIYQGSTQVVSFTADVNTKYNVSGTFFSPVTLTGGNDYDIVTNYSSAAAVGTTFTMGNSPPADVQAVNDVLTYVNGATPGSLTETSTSIWAGAFCIYDNPAISGGGTTIGVIAS